MTDTFRRLRRRAKPGVSKRRNEYLRALVGQFDDAQADRVMQMYDEFATAAVNVELPAWFYSAWAVAGIVPIVKKQQTEEEIEQGQQPDARPIAAGETDLRAIGRHITEQFKDAVRRRGKNLPATHTCCASPKVVTTSRGNHGN